jgi:hypothetical protein
MFCTFSLLAVCAQFALPAAAEEKADAKDTQPRIKVFRLQVAEPNDVLQAFNALREQGRTITSYYPPPEDKPLPGTPLPPGPALADPLPGPGRPSDPLVTPSPPAVVCRVIADARTRSFIVRGTAKDLQLAADVVAILDTPEDKPLPGTTALNAFRLKHVDAVDLVGTLHALDDSIKYRLAPVGRMKLLLATGSDEQMKELAEAIKELDIPAK